MVSTDKAPRNESEKTLALEFVKMADEMDLDWFTFAYGYFIGAGITQRRAEELAIWVSTIGWD